MVDRVCRLMEIGFRRLVNIDKGLWVAIKHREPAALNLYHDPVTSAKGVIHVEEGECYPSHLARHEWFRVFEAVPELATHDVTTNQHLIS